MIRMLEGERTKGRTLLNGDATGSEGEDAEVRLRKAEGLAHAPVAEREGHQDSFPEQGERAILKPEQQLILFAGDHCGDLRQVLLGQQLDPPILLVLPESVADGAATDCGEQLVLVGLGKAGEDVVILVLRKAGQQRQTGEYLVLPQRDAGGVGDSHLPVDGAEDVGDLGPAGHLCELAVSLAQERAHRIRDPDGSGGIDAVIPSAWLSVCFDRHQHRRGEVFDSAETAGPEAAVGAEHEGVGPGVRGAGSQHDLVWRKAGRQLIRDIEVVKVGERVIRFQEPQRAIHVRQDAGDEAGDPRRAQRLSPAVKMLQVCGGDGRGAVTGARDPQRMFATFPDRRGAVDKRIQGLEVTAGDRPPVEPIVDDRPEDVLRVNEEAGDVLDGVAGILDGVPDLIRAEARDLALIEDGPDGA